MFRNVTEAGHKVWDVLYGWGEITHVDSDPECQFPITVAFNSGYLYTKLYTRAGYNSLNHKHPALYWDKLVFDVPEQPLPDISVDTKLLIRGKNDQIWFPAYFHSYCADGSVQVWANGRSSFTARDKHDYVKVFAWKLYKEPYHET